MILTGVSVELREVTFLRGGRDIFRGLSLSIPEGKLAALLGPSGTGKTTLLKLITGELIPNQGEVFINQSNINRLKISGLFAVRKKIGMLFQNGALFSGLSVFENVAFPLREHYRLPESIIRKIVLMQLEIVGLRGAAGLMPSELSGGMARRVALARALVTSPQLMLYDEPFTGQDPITTGVLVRLIKEINQELGITSVVVSHDITKTLSIADLVYVVADGKLIGHGSPKELLTTPSPLLRQFMKGDFDGPIPFHYPAKISYYEDLGLC